METSCDFRKNGVNPTTKTRRQKWSPCSCGGFSTHSHGARRSQQHLREQQYGKDHKSTIWLPSPRWINRGHNIDPIVSSIIRMPEAHFPFKSRVKNTLAVFLAQLLILLPFSLQHALHLSNRSDYKLNTAEATFRACASQLLEMLREGSPCNPRAGGQHDDIGRPCLSK